VVNADNISYLVTKCFIVVLVASNNNAPVRSLG